MKKCNKYNLNKIITYVWVVDVWLDFVFELSFWVCRGGKFGTLFCDLFLLLYQAEEITGSSTCVEAFLFVPRAGKSSPLLLNLLFLFRILLPGFPYASSSSQLRVYLLGPRLKNIIYMKKKILQKLEYF